MGMAAAMVEFFLVLHYGLGVWKILEGEEVVHQDIILTLAVMRGTRP
jgi:hypothetical protein